ncbi:hypothetical protein [Acidaminobacter sp.]|uniref:hypothetical protein n=1 Tax=Acidaminobacter sp. TaxID=1872102 RepID=UPI001384736F|nr:hypothetical protein [Acidaminobacter sp.]MDK9710201.1 hypothetical protein [Acidaminobacter sp.]MZQ98713.1 hypothetical protein [Acidaminobacter sp.]
MLLEKAKSAILMVLFAICAYLAGQFLLDTSSISARAGSAGGNVQVSVNIEDLLNPQGYQVSFGGGLYSGHFDTGLKNSLWSSAKGLIRGALETSDYTEADQALWDEAVTQRSVTLKLPFAMTMDQILVAAGSDVSRDLLGTAAFDVIIIPTAEPGSVFLGNRSEARFVSFSYSTGSASGAESPQSEVLAALLTEIEQDEMTVEYKRIEDTFSLRTILEKPDQVYRENHIIEPIVAMPTFEKVRVQNEFSLETLSEEQERYYADIAFGARFDFVKRVREVDGSVVYLYGYGDRALRFGAQGRLEYQERFRGGSTSDEILSFKDSLTKAVAELRKYGEFPEGFYLKYFTETEDAPGVRVKTFHFSHRHQGLPTDLSNREMPYTATVEITNDQVTYLMKSYKDIQRLLPAAAPSNQILSLDRLIESQFDLILEDYLTLNPEAAASKDDFGFVYQILHDITEYELIYFLSRDNNVLTYLPAWHLGIGGNHYYFDLYTGELLQRVPTQAVK